MAAASPAAAWTCGRPTRWHGKSPHRTGGVVFSVDYRLARDGVHFPVPHEDVARGVDLDLAAHAEELGVAPAGLCLGGASAGGNLAVGAALYLKDAGLPVPARLLLAYPFLHAELPAPSDLPVAAPGPAVPDVRRALRAAAAPAVHAGRLPCPGGELHRRPRRHGVVVCPARPRRPVRAPARRRSSPANTTTSALGRGVRGRSAAAGNRRRSPLEKGAIHGYLNHSAGLRIVQDGLAFLATDTGAAKPFQ